MNLLKLIVSYTHLVFEIQLFEFAESSRGNPGIRISKELF
jgi:hypothetical protein